VSQRCGFIPKAPPLDGEDEKAAMPPAWLRMSGGLPHPFMGWGGFAARSEHVSTLTPTLPSPIEREGF
jgi:hypothetical protein